MLSLAVVADKLISIILSVMMNNCSIDCLFQPYHNNHSATVYLARGLRFAPPAVLIFVVSPINLSYLLFGLTGNFSFKCIRLGLHFSTVVHSSGLRVAGRELPIFEQLSQFSPKSRFVAIPGHPFLRLPSSHPLQRQPS